MLSFFTEAREVEHLVITDIGIEKKLGKPAIIPALPGFKFFFRFENNWAILTEAKSGRMIAHVKERSRSALQEAVAQIIATHGLKGVHQAVALAYPKMLA